MASGLKSIIMFPLISRRILSPFCQWWPTSMHISGNGAVKGTNAHVESLEKKTMSCLRSMVADPRIFSLICKGSTFCQSVSLMVARPFLENLAPWGRGSCLSQMAITQSYLTLSRSLAKSEAELPLEDVMMFKLATRSPKKGARVSKWWRFPHIGLSCASPRMNSDGIHAQNSPISCYLGAKVEEEQVLNLRKWNLQACIYSQTSSQLTLVG